MGDFPWEVFVLGAVLLANRVVLPHTFSRPPLFWGLQALDVAVAIASIGLAGLPGRAPYPVVGWMVAALLVFHIVQNFALRENDKRRREREASEKEYLRMIKGMRDEPPERTP